MNQAVDSELAGAPGVRGCMRYSRMGAPNRQIHPTSNRRKRTPGGLHQSSSDRWHLVCTLHGSGLFQLKKNQKRARHRCRTTPSSTPDTVAIRTPSVCGHPTCRSIVSRAGHQNRTFPPTHHRSSTTPSFRTTRRCFSRSCRGCLRTSDRRPGRRQRSLPREGANTRPPGIWLTPCLR